MLVSCRYAWECQTQEGGWGLDQILRDSSWKFRGIVNGMDYGEWSPQGDVHLQSDGYQNFSIDNLREGKARCKEALQKVGLSLHTSTLACVVCCGWVVIGKAACTAAICWELLIFTFR